MGPIGNMGLAFRKSALKREPRPFPPTRSDEQWPIVVYVDERAFSRESVGRWLASRLARYKVHIVADAAAAAAFAAANDSTALILKHLGASHAASPEVAANLSLLVKSVPNVPVAVLADTEQVEAVLAALNCGLRVYIPTGVASAVVVEAVRLVCAGDVYAPISALLGQATKRPIEIAPAPLPPAAAEFSPRQCQILDCLRRGMPNKNIAHALDLSEATVKVHVRNIMKKLRATNRTQVVLMTMSLFSDAGAESSMPE